MSIRTLVVDDSSVVRRIVAKVLGDDERIDVAGTAANGRVALERIESLRPDVVTLDIQMPEMSGLEALPELRRRWPELPVIVFSASDEAGAVDALAALQAGANDYVTKPSQLARISDAIEALNSELIPKILALHESAQRNTEHRHTAQCVTAPSLAPVPEVAPGRGSDCPPEIVAIGSSTGGPKALQAILPDLPVSFPVPILLAQHMPPAFTATLARSLNDKCSLEVREAWEGAEARPGELWIAPGDYHMTVERMANGCRLHLDQGAKENSCRPAVDPLFRSVAQEFGSRALGVVLTGMGSDGTLGARVLKEAGGRIAIQDEESSVVWGMPGSVAAAGLADKILRQGEVASYLQRRVGPRGRVARVDR